MGNIINWLKELDIFVLYRRHDKYDIHRTKADHPEQLPPDQFSTSNNSLHQQIPTTTTVDKKSTFPKCSEFYLSCRNNQIDKVKKLLKSLTADEIDRVEPNGSTALHAACYHGHYDIVKLLLEIGADRAIANKYKCLPYDEAKNKEIKKLFFRVPNSNRLISNTGQIEWDLIDDDVLENAAQERQLIKSIYENVTGTTSIEKMFEKIYKNYIEKGLANFDGIDKIKRFFQKAIEEQDPIWIIKAYTAETDFYKVLNQEIAAGATQYQSERRYLISLFYYHPKLNHLSYIGTSFRVMEINQDDLQKYQINSLLMTKSFLSSSIDRQIALWFLARQHSSKEQTKRYNANGILIKQWIISLYHIKHQRTALHIENSSQYTNEGEILIMPYSVFKIINIQQIKLPYQTNHLSIIQIELEECQQYLNS